MKPSARLIALALAAWALPAAASDDLPPTPMVARILREAPLVQAAGSQVVAEEAHRRRLEAGAYEWTVRIGGQRRRVSAPASADQQYREWDTALERPIRLPGKGSLDAELGARGVALAETALGDARHETARALLKHWFTWLRERETAAQWQAQADILGQQAHALTRRQQLGDASRLEQILAGAAQAQAQAQLAQARTREHTAAEELKRRYPALALPAQLALSEPQPLDGSEDQWIEGVMEHSHELALARNETRLAQTQASRSNRDRLPDPTLGIHSNRERSGEERLLGAYLSIPLPGGARAANADAALAQADASAAREAAAVQKISVEAANSYHAAAAAYATWQSGQQAAAQLGEAATLSTRAYQLGEGTLTDLLTARRLAHEGQLTARLLQLDALESRYRLMLDAHRLWDLDEDGER